jgi:hypothetical protein
MMQFSPWNQNECVALTGSTLPEYPNTLHQVVDEEMRISAALSSPDGITHPRWIVIVIQASPARNQYHPWVQQGAEGSYAIPPIFG